MLFRAEALKDVANNVMYTLGQLAEEFPELTNTLHSAAAEHDLDVPAISPTADSDGPIP